MTVTFVSIFRYPNTSSDLRVLAMDTMCSKYLTLATGRNIYLSFIGQKGRVTVGWKRTCKTMSELSYETLHEMVRKQTMATRNQWRTCNKLLDNKPATKIS